MRLIIVLAIAVLAVPGIPACAATSVFAPRPPHDAPPEVFKSDESALGAFITAQCKIQDAMGKTSAAEANELIASAEEDLRRADQGFGDVAKALGDATPLKPPDNQLTHDARAALERQSFPPPDSFGRSFSIMQAAVQNEIKVLAAVKFTDSDAANVEVAVGVHGVRLRAEYVYIAVSVLTTLASQ
jgi:hypothetical protein